MNDTTARATLGRIAQAMVTFATLPAAPVNGERAMISDGAASPSFNAIVSSGGGSTRPVYYDGADWRYG